MEKVAHFAQGEFIIRANNIMQNSLMSRARLRDLILRREEQTENNPLKVRYIHIPCANRSFD